jgi:hypothetical protein
MYCVSSDGFKYQVDTRGLDPKGFAFYGNKPGLLNVDGTPLNHDGLATTGPLQDLQGGIRLALPSFPIFFSPPASETIAGLRIPSSPVVPQISDLSFTGHLDSNPPGLAHTSTIGAGGTISFTSTVAAEYELVISRDGTNFDPSLPQNAALRGHALAGSNSVVWNGKDETGANLPPGVGYMLQASIEGGERGIRSMCHQD